MKFGDWDARYNKNCIFKVLFSSSFHKGSMSHNSVYVKRAFQKSDETRKFLFDIFSKQFWVVCLQESQSWTASDSEISLYFITSQLLEEKQGNISAQCCTFLLLSGGLVWGRHKRRQRIRKCFLQRFFSPFSCLFTPLQRHECSARIFLQQ